MAAAARIQVHSLVGGNILQDGAYLPAAGASAFVYVHGTTTQVSVFSTETSAVVLPQPLTADKNGQLPGWVNDKQDLDVVGVATILTEPYIATGFDSGVATTPLGQFVAGTSSLLLATANTARNGLQVWNNSGGALVYGSLGVNPAELNKGFRISPNGGYWKTPDEAATYVYQGAIYVISTLPGTQLTVVEF